MALMYGPPAPPMATTPEYLTTYREYLAIYANGRNAALDGAYLFAYGIHSWLPEKDPEAPYDEDATPVDLPPTPTGE